MNFFTIILCCIAAPAAFADNANPQQNGVELDRARSAWNFGGHHPIKKSTYWNRPRNVAGPGAVIANRRLGSGSAPMAPHTKKTLGAPQRRRQHKPHSQKSTHQGQGRPLTKRNTNAAPFAPPHQSAYPQTYPMSYFPNQSKLPASPSWHRSSRKLGVDPIKSRFMKEELWHLDKGEGYALKDEDLDRDSLLRNRQYETNEIEEPQVNSLNSAIHQHQHKLEKDAENMVLHSGNTGNSTHQPQQPHIVHHHHHYSVPKNESKHRTPSLTRRRRRRSADMQMPSDAQTQTLLQQLFGNNQRMTPIVTRKHYSNHIGNGKNPNSAGSPNHGSYKVPATIIAPPQFDKDDVLTMLLGSGGVTADAMGTVVATNNRYVRYGRGLPNGRRGRQLQWGTESNIRNSPQSQPQSNNHIPYVPKYSKKPISPGKKPMVHLTPPPKAPVNQAPAPSHQAHQPHPLILNVQISPMPAPRHNNGPVINVPLPQQQQPMMLQQQQSPQQINHIPQQQQQSPQQMNHVQQHVQQEIATSEPISVPAHYQQEVVLQQQPPVLQDQQQPTVNQEHQQQSVIIPEQQQAAVIQDQQPVASQEKQQHTMDYVKEQQQSNIQVEESQPMPVLEEKTPTMPYQIVYVSPNGKSKNPFKYTEWMPVYQGNSKPQKAYNYDHSSYVEPYDSKNLYKKMKSYSNKQKQSSESSPSFNYYENINDQLTDSSMMKTNVGSVGDYDSSSQNYDIDLSSLINSNGDHGGSNLLDSTAPLPPSYTSNSWQDSLNQVNHDEVIDSKSLSYAVKNNYKNELDNVLQDISSRESGIYSNSMHSENNNDIYSSNNFDSFAKSYATNNDVYGNNNFDGAGTNYASNERDNYSQNYASHEQDRYSKPEKYYTVKKVPEHLPDPIYINVPKEDDFSNELYKR